MSNIRQMEGLYHVKHFMLEANSPPEVQLEDVLNAISANWRYVDNILLPGTAGVYLIFKREE